MSDVLNMRRPIKRYITIRHYTTVALPFANGCLGAEDAGTEAGAAGRLVGQIVTSRVFVRA